MSGLILGTAEFGPTPYGEGVRTPPTTKEIIRILNLAWQGGIRTLDCSPAYGCDDVLNKYGTTFGRMNKSRDLTLEKGVYYHYTEEEKPVPGITRASVYTLEQAKGLEDVIIPVNINNLTFINVTFTNPPIIRSVFDRGRLLKEYTIKDCLGFVRRVRNGGLIIGVNSERELDEILRIWDRLNWLS